MKATAFALVLFAAQALVASAAYGAATGSPLMSPDANADAGLGPGRGSWVVGDPSDYGLDAAELERAAAAVAAYAGERYCLLVAKDGVIVHESYFSNTSSSVYESDSLGKTITAALVGVAVQQGLVDIDTPIQHYGVTAQAPWNVSGVDYFPEVTLRHLMAQSSGYGTVKPGTKMTYDSDQFIQHISYTLTAAAQKAGYAGALDWASSVFADAIGLPDLYAYDGVGEDISAGGGQMVSCRDMARVGQLILNRGAWLDADGKPYQMGKPEYFDQILEPAYPGVIDGYGFLTWLNTDMRKPDPKTGVKRSHCCAPRWGGNKSACLPDGKCGSCCQAAYGYTASNVPCDPDLPVLPEWGHGAECSDRPQAKCANLSDTSEYVSGQNLGDSFPEGDKMALPEKIGFGMGQYAKYAYMIPQLNITITTMGQSRGGSLGCSNAYDDGYTLSLIMKALEPAIMAANPKRAVRQHPVREASLQGTPRAAGDRTWQTIRADKIAYETLQQEKAQAVSAASPSRGGASEAEITGSCVCQCPPDEGFGKCFNVKASALFPPREGGPCPKEVQAKFPSPSDFCPGIGLPSQCPPNSEGSLACPPGHEGSLNKCTLVNGTKNLVTASCYFGPGDSWSGGFGEGGCTWSSTPCSYSPYYPPL